MVRREAGRMSTLSGKVALVAGGTRGASRAIAVELGRAGAFVYVTGRTTRAGRSEVDRPETIEETAELVEKAGGEAEAIRVDHLVPDLERDETPAVLGAAPASLEPLVRTMGFCMQPRTYPALREQAEEWLRAHLAGSPAPYFPALRLAELGLPGSSPATRARVRAARAKRKVGRAVRRGGRR